MRQGTLLIRRCCWVWTKHRLRPHANWLSEQASSKPDWRHLEAVGSKYFLRKSCFQADLDLLLLATKQAASDQSTQRSLRPTVSAEAWAGISDERLATQAAQAPVPPLHPQRKPRAPCTSPRSVEALLVALLNEPQQRAQICPTSPFLSSAAGSL